MFVECHGTAVGRGTRKAVRALCCLTSRPILDLCFILQSQTSSEESGRRLEGNSGIVSLKGECLEISDFWLFSFISFPQAPEYTNRAVFFKNSRIYSQFKVHHQCHWHRLQMEKIFNQKNFNYFVWTPLGRRVNILYKFLPSSSL